MPLKNFLKKFRCPVLSVIKLVTTLKHPKISNGFWFYSDFPRLHTLFPTLPNNNFRTEQNHSFGVCRLRLRHRHQPPRKCKNPDPPRLARWAGILYSVYRQLSTYLCIYVCMYICIYVRTALHLLRKVKESSFDSFSLVEVGLVSFRRGCDSDFCSDFAK